MAWLVGVDEAGYGPNLGPLVVAATAWRVEAPDADLYELLGAAVARRADRERIAIADSKQLYQPGGGLRLLELGVGAGLTDVGENWALLLDRLQADPNNRRSELPWHKGFDPALPVDASAEELSTASARLQTACHGAKVAPPLVRARLVFPGEFNDLVERHGTKGAALSHVTLGLLSEVIDQAGGGPVSCVLDKHGGRNHYGPLLQHHFPDDWVETLVESRPESRYVWGKGAGRVEAAFKSGGEAFLPTALASMTAKYLRELAMRALNDFWVRHLPGLRPTAGYPVDAKRFKADIAAKQTELGIDDHLLWRNR